MALFIVLVIAGALVLGLVLAVRAVQKSEGAPARKLRQELGLPEGSPLAVERHDRSFTFKYTPGGKNTPPSLRITTNVDEANELGAGGAYREGGRDHVEVRPAIVLRRETRMDRFGKWLGLNREVEVGDAEFDAAVYIETDSPEEDVQRTLADDGLRKAVRDLLDARAQRVVLDPTGLHTSRLVGTGLESDYDVDRMTALLAQAAAALPLFKAGRAARPRTQVVETVALTAGSLAMAVLMVAGGRSPLGHDAMLVGVGGGFFLWALGVLAAMRLLGGRSDSLRRVAVLSFAGLVCLPYGTYQAVCWANRTLDTTPAVDHATRITRTWSTRGKSTTYYHVDVASWREGEQTVSLGVSPSFANKAAAGMPIVVTTHAGKLGWEWVDTFHLTK